MLVITRKVGESFTIGDDVTVTVLGDRHGGVRIGIEAPSQTLVLRTELLERARTSATRPSVGARGSGSRSLRGPL